MSIFSRVRDIISSNLNSMLEKAEDPEKLIRLMIHEMEDTLVEIKAACAGVMAESKEIGREAEDVTRRAKEWADRVEVAVRKGRDDLAREALVQKRQHSDRAEALEREGSEHEGLVTKYKDDIEKLEQKLQTAREKHRVLVQRHVRARQSRRAREQVRRADNHDAIVRFDKFEKRIDRMEAEADLVNHGARPSLEDDFRAIEDDDLERELDEVKRRVAAEGDRTKP